MNRLRHPTQHFSTSKRRQCRCLSVSSFLVSRPGVTPRSSWRTATSRPKFSLLILSCLRRDRMRRPPKAVGELNLKAVGPPAVAPDRLADAVDGRMLLRAFETALPRWRGRLPICMNRSIARRSPAPAPRRFGRIDLRSDSSHGHSGAMGGATLTSACGFPSSNAPPAARIGKIVG